MVGLKSILKSIGLATLGNVLGRLANVLIPLVVISAYGADKHTDQFFFVLAVAFFFYGTTANAITETTVPLLVSGRLSLSRGKVFGVGLGFSGLVLLCALGWNALFGGLALVYATALALLAGAGLFNGLATGARYAEESYALPGLLWMVRLLPLGIFFVARVAQAHLAWLAVGLGLADWLRGMLLAAGPPLTPQIAKTANAGGLGKAVESYGVVLAASLIMGLNPIVDRIIAERCGPGAISILETGERLYGMLAGLATMGLMTVLLTRLSKQGQGDEAQPPWRSMLRLIGAWILVWLLLGVGAGLWGLNPWLEGLTPLSAAQSRAVKTVYWCYLAGLPAFVLGVAYVKRLQARLRLRVLVLTAALAVALNIPASLVLAEILGVPGIALATTIVYVLNCVVLIGVDRKMCTY